VLGRAVRVSAGLDRLQLAAHCPPVEVELAGKGADAPDVAMQGAQVHPDLLRLHGGPSWLSGL
jgi:hypothetical protein